MADDLPYPSMAPPKQFNHCNGWYERNAGGKIYWRTRFPIIAIENLPLNLKFVDDHWIGRILPNGTTFLGKTPNGNPVYGKPTKVDHTRKTPEASKKDEQVVLPKQPDPVVPQKQDPVAQPPTHQSNASLNLKPGAYTPGGTPKMHGDVSFDTHVEYRTIPSRQDYDYHDDNTIDESNAVNEDEDPYQISTVAPLLTRMKYASNPNAHWYRN
jgi:hypothetical protein